MSDETLRRAAREIRGDWPDGFGAAGWATSQALVAQMETRFHRAVADLLEDAADALDLNTPTGEAALVVARTYLAESGIQHEPRCQYVSATPWGASQCALPAEHEDRHAFSPSEADHAQETA